jgi:hypothetical protein
VIDPHDPCIGESAAAQAVRALMRVLDAFETAARLGDPAPLAGLIRLPLLVVTARGGSVDARALDAEALAAELRQRAAGGWTTTTLETRVEFAGPALAMVHRTARVLGDGSDLTFGTLAQCARAGDGWLLLAVSTWGLPV